MATYGSETGVESINSHFIGGYTASTVPTNTAVGIWLVQGYAALNLALKRAGYQTPVTQAAAPEVYDVLTRLNDLYAAACAEQATNISTAGPGEETRSEKLWKEYHAGVADLVAGDGTLLGLTLTTPASTDVAQRPRIRSFQTRNYDGYAINADYGNGGEYTRGARYVRAVDEYPFMEEYA